MASHVECAPEELTYGSWPSPITAKFITGSSVGLGSVKSDGVDVYWLESRPQEGGRNVVVRYDPSSPDASERGGVEVTPKEHNVRTRVHEYGGGAYALRPSGGLIFSDFASQRLYATDPASGTRCVTPETPEGQYRYADFSVSGDGAYAVCVREDHGPTGDRKPSEVVNEVVKVDLNDGTQRVVATGRDFYAAPRLSPDELSVARSARVDRVSRARGSQLSRAELAKTSPPPGGKCSRSRETTTLLRDVRVRSGLGRSGPRDSSAAAPPRPGT